MTKNDTPTWITDPKAYREKLHDLLGGADPIDVIAKTPDTVARIVRKHMPERMRTRPFDGKWTPNEIVGHLADAEWVFGFRMRLILSEDQPTILGMDQELWVSSQRHNEQEPAALVDSFRSLRRINVPLWKRMTPADLERTGQHSERGPESLGVMLGMVAGHDLSHIDQIKRYLEAAPR